MRCQVCDRELRFKESLQGFLRPFGIQHGKGKRARWLCRRCLRRIGRSPAPREGMRIKPSHASVALQRKDLQWYGGSAEGGGYRWVPSQRQALLFQEEEDAHQVMVKLRREGHSTHSIVIFRRGQG